MTHDKYIGINQMSCETHPEHNQRKITSVF